MNFLSPTIGNIHESPSSDPAKPGLGHSVCILYAYDSCGSHVPPTRVYVLAKSLSQLGFEVFCECVGRMTPQRDWTRWYSIILSHCDSVILMPSPTMAQAFTNTSTPSPDSDCVKVFTKVHQTLSNKSETVLQYNIVILAKEHDHNCVPMPFASQKIFRLTDSDFNTASFSHTSSSSNEYHSLVLCMARQSSNCTPQPKVVDVTSSNSIQTGLFVMFIESEG